MPFLALNVINARGSTTGSLNSRSRYLRPIVARINIASAMAKVAPMQTRGPAPKGR
jgi:hypothetical protein